MQLRSETDKSNHSHHWKCAEEIRSGSPQSRTPDLRAPGCLSWRSPGAAADLQTKQTGGDKEEDCNCLEFTVGAFTFFKGYKHTQWRVVTGQLWLVVCILWFYLRVYFNFYISLKEWKSERQPVVVFCVSQMMWCCTLQLQVFLLFSIWSSLESSESGYRSL